MCSELNFILFTEILKTLTNTALQGLGETRKVMNKILETITEL
jgi:hypothetical protein